MNVAKGATQFIWDVLHPFALLLEILCGGALAPEGGK